MQRRAGVLAALVAALFAAVLPGQPREGRFAWPEGKQCALSLSFDDARPSQVDAGLELLDRLGAKATFFVVPSRVEERLEGWKKAAAAGHEIGNHSLNHPCTGNFPWSRGKALEDYTLEKMRRELAPANRRIEELLGIEPKTFAYPCGNKFVGRGEGTRSYVPVVAELFTAGRGWLDETPNDPAFCDLAQVQGMEMDGKSFEEMRALVEAARERGQWVVLGGHEIGEQGLQTTRIGMLEQLIPYAQDPANGVWLATVGEAAEYILERRGQD